MFFRIELIVDFADTYSKKILFLSFLSAFRSDVAILCRFFAIRRFSSTILSACFGIRSIGAGGASRNI